MAAHERYFGNLSDGRKVATYTLRDDTSGFSADILPFGATLRRLCVPDRQGRPIDSILRYESLEQYEADRVYLGALVGRWAGRLAHGLATVDGKRLELTRNEGPHHLHGGARGLSRALWEVVHLEAGPPPSLTLAHVSPRGEEGYPGWLRLRATYQIASPASLTVSIEAETDEATLLNVTLHPYFNLGGAPIASIDRHLLRIEADSVMAVRADGIATGEAIAVTGTPFDFRAATELGKGLSQPHQQLQARGGYDHYFPLRVGHKPPVELANPRSGLRLRVNTNQPGVQLYSGNALAAGSAHQFPDRAGVCIEPQGIPTANGSDAGGILQPGQRYQHITTYSFDATA